MWFQGPVVGGARGVTWGWSLVCAVCQACTQVCCEMTPDGRAGSQVPSFAHASLIGWRWPCCWLSAEDGDGVSVWSRQTLLLFSLFKIVFYLFFCCLAALGLHCCAWTFSRCGEQGLLPRGAAWAAHCSGFSCCRAWALGAWGQEVQPASSVAAVCRLPSTGSVVAARGRCCPRAWRSLRDQGSNPCPLHWQMEYH